MILALNLNAAMKRLVLGKWLGDEADESPALPSDRPTDAWSATPAN